MTIPVPYNKYICGGSVDVSSSKVNVLSSTEISYWCLRRFSLWSANYPGTGARALSLQSICSLLSGACQQLPADGQKKTRNDASAVPWQDNLVSPAIRRAPFCEEVRPRGNPAPDKWSGAYLIVSANAAILCRCRRRASLNAVKSRFKHWSTRRGEKGWGGGRSHGNP